MCVSTRSPETDARREPHNGSYLFAILLDFFEGLCTVDSEYAEKAFAASHVLITHSTVFFLTSGVLRREHVRRQTVSFSTNQDIEQACFTIDNRLFTVGILCEGGNEA